MNRRTMLRYAGAAGAAVSARLAAPVSAQAADPKRPNLLFLFADDMRWDAMGCAGNRLVQTPNLDKLAAESVLFSNAFVTTSICAPNRACVLAGQHQRTTGIKDFATPFTEEQLDQTYPVLLRKAGYRTGFMGKWGVGASSEEALELPASKFDYWRGFVGQGKFFHEVDGKRVHLTTELVPQQASEFLDGCRADQPFCLSISFKAPHGPWQDFDPALADLYTGDDLPPLPATFTKDAFEALPDHLRNSLNGMSGSAHDNRWGARRNPNQPAEMVAQYYRLITGLDIAVGKLVAELKRRGLYDNTVILFTSDNGHFLFEQGLFGKWLMYEQSIRVPLIVRDPRLPAATRGTRREEMALTIDMAPTMLALAGAPIPDAMQGRDLGPLLRGEDVVWRTDWFYEHTFTLPPPRIIAKSQGVRTERWKYIRYLDTNPNYEQLFDLQNDPNELTNLAGEPAHRATLDALREHLLHYRHALPDNNPEPQEYGHFRTVTLSDEIKDTPHDFGAAKSLGQTFLVEGNKLQSLRFRTPTWGKREVPCGLVVELLAGGPKGRALTRRTIAKDAIANNGWNELRLDQPVKLGETLYLRVRSEKPIPARTIGWWGYCEDLYLDGAGHVDDQPGDFDLELSLMYEDPEGFVPPKRTPAPPKTKFRLHQGQQLPPGQCPKLADKAILVSATVEPKKPNGVIVAQGGHGNGFALYVSDGRLAMAIRHTGKLTTVSAPDKLPAGKTSVAGRLAKDGTVTLEVAGQEVASGKAPGTLPATPGDPLECGADHTTAVGDYEVPNTFVGTIGEAVVQITDARS